MQKFFYVYIMTNETNTALYTGITKDLVRRVQEHKEGITDGFTKRYKINRVVYHEVFEDAYSAIQREKQIKVGSRRRRKKRVCQEMSYPVEWHPGTRRFLRKQPKETSERIVKKLMST